MKKPQIKDERRRQLMLAVIDGDQRLVPIMWHWNKLGRCDEILSWCKAAGLTGQNLFEYLQSEYGNQILAPARDIIASIERENEVRPIIVGRDYI